MRYNRGMVLLLTGVLLTAVTARAGSHMAQSAEFTVDTRDGIRPVVQDVTCLYCDKNRHVYFLKGIPLSVTFSADIDWNGKEPGTISFARVKSGGGLYESYGDLTGERTFDVSNFEVGDSLKVKAYAKDGTASQEVTAHFDVIALPLFWNNIGFYPQVLSKGHELVYNTLALDLEVWPKTGGVVKGCPLPGEKMEIQPHFQAEASFSGDGALTIKAARGKNNTVKLNGTQRRYRGRFGEAAGFEFGFDLSGEVVSVWDKPSGSWKVSSGMLGLSAHEKQKGAPFYIYAPPPIYLRADAGFDFTAGVRIRDLGEGGGWTPDFAVQSEAFPELRGVLGCGIGRVMSVEGYVGVFGKFELQAPPLVCKKLGVEGKIGAEIIVAGFATAPIDIWSGSSWIVDGVDSAGMMVPLPLSPERLALNLSDLDTLQFQPMGREYLNRRGISSPMATQPQSRIVSLTGGSETVLEANGYPYPEPAVAVAGVTNHVLYVRDNAGRLAENRTELVDVFNAGEGWTVGSPVWDDGTGDFAPQVAALSNGMLLSVWANGRSALTNGASLDDALRGLEIAVGERNPATGVWTCRNLTTNSWMDHSPMVTAGSNGNAMAAWIRNRDLNPTGTAGEPNEILFSQRTNGMWSTEGSAVTNLGTMTYCDFAYNGSQAALVFAVDGDGDLATADDQELYGSDFNGSQWGPCQRLTTNAVQDTRPYVRYDLQGQLLLVWYQGGKILSATGLELVDITVAGVLGIGSSAQDFKLVTGTSGQMAVVWPDAGAAGDGSPDPYILNYDPARQVWGRGVRLLEDPALERGFGGAFGVDGRLRLAYSKVAVGDSNGVPVLGAVDLCVLDHPVGSDPAVAEYGIALSTNSAAFGESLGISVTVENRGDLAVSNLAVCVYEGDPAAGGVLLGGTQRVAQVLGGTSAVVNVAWMLPEAASNVVLYAMVDPAMETDDRNRANNTATLAALMPDLSLDGASVLNESTNVRLVRASVMNEGAVPVAAGTQVTFRRGAPEGALLAEDTLGALVFGTNGTYDAGFRWDMSGTTFTSAFEVVYIAVDPANAVGEIEERNNTTAVQVMTSLDSDGDGLLDGEEQRLGTRTDLADSDGDGLDDYAEVRRYGTNPLLQDTDNDGAIDGQEIAAGTDPNSATDVFKIVAADGAETYAMSVTWNAKSGSVYRVETASRVTGVWGNAPDNAGSYGSSLQTAVSNGVLRYCDTQAGMTNRFYRVRFVVP